MDLSTIQTLDEWGVISDNDPYTAPELRRYAYVGKIGNLQSARTLSGRAVKERDEIQTSAILKQEVFTDTHNVDHVIVHTYSGSVYCLLNPHPQYEQEYPNSYQRLIDSIKKETQS